MQMLEHHHESIFDQITNAVVRSATNHSVGALMRGHSVIGVLVIAAFLIVVVWFFKRAL